MMLAVVLSLALVGCAGEVDTQGRQPAGEARLVETEALQQQTPVSRARPASLLELGETRRDDAPRKRRRGFSPTQLPLMAHFEGYVEPCLEPQWRKSGAPFGFYFTRAAYSGLPTQGFASWSVDYPKADRQFLVGLERLVNHLDLYSCENPMMLDDPALLEFPFLYAVEAGHMALSQEETAGLRRYLLSGGFLMVDDFWGTREWENLEDELRAVLPEYPIVELTLDHPVFHSFYDIQKLVQVPNVGLGRAGGRTFEKDGYVPGVHAIVDDRDRLMVLINWNCDLGDAWEWAEDPYYPLEFSTYAYQIGVNAIVYAMTH